MSRLRPWLLFARVYRLGIKQYPEITVDPRFEFHPPSKDELASAYAQYPQQLDQKMVEAALARGDICMAAFDRDNDNRMAGFVFGTTGTALHGDGLWVAVDYPNIYGYKGYVDPAYRGMGVNQAMIAARDQVILRDGYRFSVGFVETHNYPSVRSNVFLGSDALGYAGYLKLFGRAFPFRTPKAKKSTLRFYRNQALY